MEEEDRKKSSHDWLKEHDFIQSELLKMKEELLNGNRGKVDEEEEPVSRNPPVEERGPESSPEPIRPGPVPREEEEPEDKPEEDEEDQDDDGSVCGPPGDRRREGPKLPEGKLPAAPDLTSKIANVLQLENKLKRRKFEMEKNIRDQRSEQTRSDARMPGERTGRKDREEEVSERPAYVNRERGRNSPPPLPPTGSNGPGGEGDREDPKIRYGSEKGLREGGEAPEGDGHFRRVIRRRMIVRRDP